MESDFILTPIISKVREQINQSDSSFFDRVLKFALAVELVRRSSTSYKACFSLSLSLFCFLRGKHSIIGSCNKVLLQHL